MQTGGQMQRLALRLLRSLGLIFTSIFFFIVIVCVLVIVQGGRSEQRSADAALVLGAAQWNGAPSPVLRARLDHALFLYQGDYVKQIIVTGGVAEGDQFSEAEVSRQYLLDRGAPDEILLVEDQSATTWQNLTNARDLIRLNGIESVLLVSDPFHMLRSLKMAQDLGLEAYASPTRTSPISDNFVEETRAIVREGWAYTVYVFARR